MLTNRHPALLPRLSAEIRALQEQLERSLQQMASAQGQAAAAARGVKEVVDALAARNVTVEQLQVCVCLVLEEGGVGRNMGWLTA